MTSRRGPLKDIEMATRHHNLPRLSRLLAFEAAARHLNFTEASKELSVTQAAISQQIKLLEQELGITLFERLQRGLAMTEEGTRLLRGVSSAFDCIADATEDARSAGHRISLKIGATLSVATFWLVPRLAQFCDLHPDIDVRLITTDRGYDDIADQVDVGIAFGNGDWSGLHATQLLSPKVFPVYSPDYLKRCGEPKSAIDLLDETLLFIDKKQMVSDGDWRHWLCKFNVDPGRIRQSITFNSHSLLVQATRGGQGISLGWSLLTDDLIARNQLVRVTNDEVQGSSNFYYVETSNRPHYARNSFKKWIYDEIT